ALRHGEGVKPKEDCACSTQHELHVRGLPSCDVNHPHGCNETHSSPHPDGRKVLHDIQTVTLENDVRNRIVQCDCRHVEHGVQQHYVEHPCRVGDCSRPDQCACA